MTICLAMLVPLIILLIFDSQLPAWVWQVFRDELTGAEAALTAARATLEEMTAKLQAWQEAQAAARLAAEEEGLTVNDEVRMPPSLRSVHHAQLVAWCQCFFPAAILDSLRMASAS